ncbi:uncharacterized protein Z518_08329 [Rhinocladiella mackenziei CBS 650.93]|uniref:Uncharacterized protein n=1 Tax=Rhinocladiella mackenziei CBS 650.93 TaxID=1442369 RepID=A0A0D2GVV0_9EURO|nr:uncharacterized protein Z518_08329 [Rhinocladiella mackenziei CBS 650.93]KIX02388.1 hypothetical protein Z518_08329 [Rhinocladiella mackenziei CBS 650.93]
MTTFIAKSPTVGHPSWVSSRQSSESPQQATSVSNADFVDFVDLTPSHRDAARENLIEREILEPTGHNPDERGIRVARAHSTGATDNDKIKDGEEDDKDDDDINYEIETSDLSSLQDIFARSGTGFGGNDDLSCKAFASLDSVDRTSKDRCHEGNSEHSANPAATNPTCIHPGASRDNPIVLDDDQPVDTHDADVSNDEKPIFEVADSTTFRDPFPTLSGEFAERGADDGDKRTFTDQDWELPDRIRKAAVKILNELREDLEGHPVARRNLDHVKWQEDHSHSLLEIRDSWINVQSIKEAAIICSREARSEDSWSDDVVLEIMRLALS